MNDTMSLILATSILAIGGLGLYMYKNSAEDQDGGSENNEGIFDFFGSKNSEYDDELVEDPELEEDDDDYDDYKPRSKRGGAKTKRNKKAGGTKRRY